MKKLTNLLLCFSLVFSACKKEEEIIYDVNPVNTNSYNSGKDKLKSISQYISILYANLFQKALSANELVEISNCIMSIGDKEVANEIILSNFMNKTGVIMPSDSVMRADIDAFLEETYSRFFIRNISEAEREFFKNFLATNPDVSVEMVYTAFSLSNEYQFY
ncbi:MAG: hypothetical protein CBC83_10185 [Flavobacteriales bacterium TMED123]|nr:MAG: hypothetical protein CBC83_10185 [Flavobacteriales bacterium TMED123]